MSGGPRPLRAVRVETKLWAEAKQAAAKNGDNLSAIIRDALSAYIQKDESSTFRCESCASGESGESGEPHAITQQVLMARYIRARAAYYKSEDNK